MTESDFVDYLHAFADDAIGCTISASASIHRCADELHRLAAVEPERDALRAQRNDALSRAERSEAQVRAAGRDALLEAAEAYPHYHGTLRVECWLRERAGGPTP